MIGGNLKPSQRTAIVGVIDPDLNTAGTVRTGWVDMSKIFALLAIVSAGALGNGATLDAKIEQAKDGDGTDAKDVDGKAITQLTEAGGDSDKQALIDLFANDLDVNAGFTHARLSMTVATASSDSSALLISFDPRYGPASGLNADTVIEIV